MADQHRATPHQWAFQEAWAVDDDDSSCILELRARVEALEGKYETMRLATLEWGKSVDNHGRWIDDHLKRIHPLMVLEAGQRPSTGATAAPADSLVDRVADAIAATPTSIDNDRLARAAIREVAAAATQMHPDANLTWERVASWLVYEASQ